MLVFALQHIGFIPIGISKIARCWICHRDIYLASTVLHRTFQLSATIEHMLRLLTSPRISIEYSLQTKAKREHPFHIRHLRGIEVGNIEFRQTRAIIEHRVHIRHLRGIEVGDIQRRQTRTTIEHSTHIRHRRGVEVFKSFDSGEF